MHRTLRTLLSLALMLGSLSPFGTAQSDDAKLEAVKDFKTYMRKARAGSERVEAVKTLLGNECPQAAEELLKLAADRTEPVRIAAMSVLATYKRPETFKAMYTALPDMADKTAVALLIEVLGRAGILDALPAIRQVGIRDAGIDTHVKVRVADAIERLGDRTGSNDILVKYLADPDPTVRISAADAVGKLKLRAIGDHLVPLLSDKYWQVQAAAILASGQARVEKAIDPLIELMRHEGRFKTDTAEALFLITMKDFGANPDLWAKSLTSLRGFGWKMPSDAEVAKAKAARKRSDEFYGKKDGRKTFGGIVTTSTRVLFIIDISGSMEDHVVEKQKFTGSYEDYSKLSIVKTELVNTIDSLDKNTLFNIVAFATNLRPWKKDLVPANVVTKSAAKAWVRRLKPLGGSESSEAATVGLSSDLSQGKTNTFKALMYPFDIDPDKEIKVVFTGGDSRRMVKRKLDTVFFLSDGRPSVGKYVDTEEILKEVLRVNKVYRMTLHTIAIGQFQKTFLQTLAQQNGGEFVDLGF
ncbi:MAG: HEAT repeat domain-containing protein [Planctomycetes bacterium]|nr:HEAT repeat domain-containing protein [Planctomycetota bacterium]MCB9868469.1 HEAT repeat domain-containing protein [Planctomycetota bacterium]